jgi:D-serine deaminase-like pyridoxal phosphate-dependent protein
MPTELISEIGSSGAVPGMRIGEIRTPCLLLDLDRLERTMVEFPARVTRHGVTFRPHVKTCKNTEIGRLLQEAAGSPGIAVAKVAEAEVFAAAGFRDIVVAYPVVGEEKWARIANLARQGARMTVNFDNEIAARGISKAATAAGTLIHLQMEINAGMNRCGLWYEDIEGIARLARYAGGLPGLDFEGITTHRQVFYDGVTTVPEAGHSEGRLMTGIAQQLRSAGIPVRQVTGGGTIVGPYVAEIPGMTEVRSGTYVAFDLMNVNLGTIRRDDVALSVLTTVQSRWGADTGTCDAGSKTFSGDRGVVGTGAGIPQVVELKGMAEEVSRDIWIERLTEEHGMFRCGAGENPQIGEKLRFYPYHACTPINLADEYVGVRGDVVEKVFRVEARGKRT